MAGISRRALLLGAALAPLSGCASGVLPPLPVPEPGVSCGNGVRAHLTDVRPRNPDEWLTPQLVFSPDGTEVIAPTGGHGHVVWSLATGRIVRRSGGYDSGGSHYIAWNPSRPMLGTPSCASQTRLFSPTDFQEIGKLTGHRDVRIIDGVSGVGVVSFSPDGSRVATSADDGLIKLWDIDRRVALWSKRSRTSAPATLEFSPDGRWIVEGDYNDPPVVWDARTGDVVHVLSEIPQAPYPVHSPDGSRILMGGWDGALYIVDAQSRRVLERRADLGVRVGVGPRWTSDGRHVVTDIESYGFAVWTIGESRARAWEPDFDPRYRGVRVYPSPTAPETFYMAHHYEGIFEFRIGQDTPVRVFEKAPG